MFGQGNPAPRPGASFQQLPLGAPQPFQQGGQRLGRPVMQHFSNQSGSHVYQTAPMPPHPHVQQVPQSGMPNSGLYVHPALPHLGGNLISYHYPHGQQSSQLTQQFGVQNLYHAAPPRPCLPPPPPPPPPLPPASHCFQHSELFKPPPPPPSANIMYKGVSRPMPPAGHQGFTCIEPPPPLASALHKIARSESSSHPIPNDSHLVFTIPPPTPSLLVSPLPFAPASPPSGQPGSNANELTSAVVIAASESPSAPLISNGCPDPISMSHGNAYNEPTLTSRNDVSSENVDHIYHEGKACVPMVDGSSVCDHKSELLRHEAGTSSQLNSLTGGGGLCSTDDSDMDMEDDIMNLVEDLETNDSPRDQNFENLTRTEELDAKEQLHGQIPSPASSSVPGEGVLCGDLPGQRSGTESPIKLLQGYASDDASERHCAENFNDVSHILPAIGESSTLKKVREPNLVRDGGLDNHCTTGEESSPVYAEHSLMQNRVTTSVKETEMDVKGSFTTSGGVGKAAKQFKRDMSKDFLGDESQHLSKVDDRSKPGDMTSKREKSGGEDPTASVQLKVDEFGRLARDVSSDSDSDGLRYNRKRGRRGKSRSISPLYRRRTPVGRRNYRSRSRSRSPLKRRSRSRSPGYRRPNESITERRRRDKIQTSVCFNFRDGRCRRGSSCRFLHIDSDRSGSSNYYKSKQRPLSEAALGNNDPYQEKSKGSLGEMGSHGDEKAKSHELEQLNRSKGVLPDSGRDDNVTDRNEVGHGITVVEHTQLDQDGHIMVSHLHKHEDGGGKTAHVVEAPMAQVARDQNATNLLGNDRYQKSAQTCHPYDASGLQSLVNSSAVLSSKEPSEVNQSATVFQYAGQQTQKLNISYESISVQHQSLGTLHQLTTSDPRLDGIPSSSQSYDSMASRSQPVLCENHSLQLPCGVLFTPFPQVATGHCMPQLQRNSMQPSMSLPPPSMSLPPPFTPGGGPSYNQFSLPNQPHQSNRQPNAPWTSLPPPLPRPSLYANIPNTNTLTSGNTIPSRFEQNQQPQRNDVALQNISGPYAGQVHYNSQFGGNQHENYHPSHEAHIPSLAFPVHRPNSLFMGHLQTQQIEGHLGRNDQTSVQGLIPSSFHLQQNTSLIGPPAIKMLPSSEIAYEISSQNDNILEETSLNDHRNYVAGDSRFIGLPGKIEPDTLRTSSANLDVSGISEFERSRTLVRCNPYASTFDRPLASILSQPQMGGQGVEGHGLKETSPSTSSVRNAGQNFPGSGGGHQYDPLLDSIDKMSNSLVNSERVYKQRSTSDSDNMLRRSVSRKPLDVEETNRKKESEAIASLTSSENDEFGETADAEAGVVENESFSNPVDMPNIDGEVAISETFSDKKSKDSRSMKLFKSAIANFVKEVLKPSWRQGNMSKEAFKTIVKKTVEKVSGAMKGHRYPKSQAKINHYIDSSQRKLTKLVMGYVDKYVKV